MDILVAGAHGQVAVRLLRQLVAHGHHARGLIRNPDHAGDLEAIGAVPVLCDLEHDDPRPHIGGAEAIVFAAGAGAGSGPERKRTVDYGAAKALIDAARELGVMRYVMLSAMGTTDVEHAPEGMQPYLQAKRDADDALRTSGLDWTIVKPGHLVDGPGTGKVDAAAALGRHGDIPREDVAAVITACLTAQNTIRAEFEVVAGDTPIDPAVRAISGGPVEH